MRKTTALALAVALLSAAATAQAQKRRNLPDPTTLMRHVVVHRTLLIADKSLFNWCLIDTAWDSSGTLLVGPSSAYVKHRSDCAPISTKASRGDTSIVTISGISQRNDSLFVITGDVCRGECLTFREEYQYVLRPWGNWGMGVYRILRHSVC